MLCSRWEVVGCQVQDYILYSILSGSYMLLYAATIAKVLQWMDLEFLLLT